MILVVDLVVFLIITTVGAITGAWAAVGLKESRWRVFGLVMFAGNSFMAMAYLDWLLAAL